MSKNLSLQTRTLYQISLISIGIISLLVVILSGVQAVKLLSQAKDEPVVKIREQQLNTAINLVLPDKDVH